MTKPINRFASIFFAFFILFQFNTIQKSEAQTLSNNLQIITPTPSSFNVCGVVDSFKVTVKNVAASAANNPILYIKMPIGFQYVANSVRGISGGIVSQNIIVSNDSFSIQLPTIAASNQVVLSFKANCDCNIIATQNTSGASSIINKYKVIWNSNSFFNKQNTAAIPILVPAISVAIPTNQNYNSGIGPSFTYTRDIKITNGGNGHLRGNTLRFYDVNGSNIQILKIYPTGQPLVNLTNKVLNGGTNGDTSSIVFSSSEIAAYAQNGDGDTLLETNEFFALTELVQVSGCNNLSSNISSWWGCFGNNCSNSSNNNQTTAGVNLPNTYPTLTINWQYDNRFFFNRCLGTADPRIHKLVIKNTGTGNARNISVLLHNMLYNYGMVGENYLDTTNIKIQYNNGPQQHPKLSFAGASNGGKLPSSSVCGNTNYGQFYVLFDSLKVNDSATITVYQIDCPLPYNYCNGGWIMHQAKVLGGTYQDVCATTTYQINGTTTGTTSNIGFSGIGLKNCPTDMIPGNSYNIGVNAITTLNPPYPKVNNKGSVDVQLTIPTGLYWDGNLSSVQLSSGLNGIIWQAASVSITGDSTIGSTVIFHFPIAQNPFGGAYGIVYQAGINCNVRAMYGSTFAGAAKNIGVNFLYNLDTTCATTALWKVACFTLNTILHLPSAPCTVAGGMQNLSFDVKRNSFGTPDNNNDGLQDASGALDFTKIRLDRATWKDTMKATFIGLVNIQSGSPSFNFGYTNVRVAGYNIAPLWADVKIFDSSANIQYTLNKIGLTQNNYDGVRLNFSPVNLQSAGLPSNYHFGNGDSVSINLYFRNERNDANNSASLPVTTEFYLSNIANPNNTSDKYSCDNFSGSYNYFGWNTSYTCGYCNDYTINGCNQQLMGADFIQQQNNPYAFPYEYRNLIHAKSIKYFLPHGYNIDSIRAFFYPNNWVKISSYSNNGDTLIIPLETNYKGFGGNVPLPSWQAATYLQLRIYAYPTCQVPSNIVQKHYYQITDKVNNFFGGFDLYQTLLNTPNPNPNYNTSNSISLFQLGMGTNLSKPNLVLSTSLPQVDVISQVTTVDFSLNNTSSTSPSDSIWLSFQNFNAGQILQLYELPALTPLTRTNDIFHAKGLNINQQKNFRATLKYTSCTVDSLNIYCGWNCSTLPKSYSSSICSSDTMKVKFAPKDAELQLTAINLTPNNSLCNTDSFDLQILNSQVGSAFGITASIILPAGMIYVNGSSSFTFPINSSAHNIADPIMNGDTLIWKIDSSINTSIAANGLPGIAQQPNGNTCRIKFKAITDCNYISGSIINANISGNSLCGKSVTKYVTLPQPLVINGLSSPYNTSIQITTPNGFSVCNNQSGNLIRVKVYNLGSSATGSNDKINISIPSNYAYLSNSFNGNHNAPVSTSPSITTSGAQSQLQWIFPSGVTSGDSMIWDFKLISTSVYCNSFNINSQTLSQSTTVACTSLSTNCSLTFQTGAANFSFNSSTQKIQLSNFSVTPIINCSLPDSAKFSVTIINTGINQVNQSNIKIYADVNHNSFLDLADTLITSYLHSTAINANQQISLTIPANIKAFKSCSWLAVLDTSKLCACDSSGLQTQAINKIIYKNFAGRDTSICSNAIISMGKCGVSGFQYQWLDSSGLSNAHISNPTLSIENRTAVTKIFTFRLQVNTGCSVITDTVIIKIYPSDANAGADLQTCVFTPVNLNGSSAVSGTQFLWSPGTNLSATNVASPSALLNDTSTFVLKTTSVKGCISFDTVTIFVNPTAQINLSPSVTICASTGTTLQPTVTSGSGHYSYSWLPPVNLSSTTIATPIASPTANTTYQLTVIDSMGGCSTVATTIVNVQICAITAIPDTAVTIENTPVNIPIVANDLTNGNIVTASMKVFARHGSVTIQNGIAKYTPQNYFDGLDTFVYILCVSPGYIICDTALVTIRINSVNHKPIANNDIISTSAGIGVSISVLGNDVDYDDKFLPHGNISTASISLSANLIQPQHGSLVILGGLGNGQFQYTPNNASYIGNDTFEYIVCDNGAPNLCDTAIVVIHIGPCTLQADAGLSQTVCYGSFINIGGSPKTAIGGNAPYKYIWHASDYSAVDSVANPAVFPSDTTVFVVTVVDSVGCVAFDTVTLNIKPYPILSFIVDTIFCEYDSIVNLQGIPSGGFFTGSGILQIGSSYIFDPSLAIKNSPFQIAYIYTSNGCTYTSQRQILVNSRPTITLSNDTTICPYINSRTVQLNASGGTTYSWAPSIWLNDSTISNPIATPLSPITYFVTVTKNGCTGIDSVKINICNPANFVIAYPDYYVTSIDSTIQLNLLQNDSSAISLNDRIRINIVLQPANGVVYNSGGQYFFSPNLGFVGTDYCIYNLCDTAANGTVYCDSAIVFFKIYPRAKIDSIGFTSNTIGCEAYTFNVLSNDKVGAFINTTAIQIIAQPKHGNVTVNQNNLVYLTEPKYLGTDSLAYKIFVNGLSDSTKVFINIDCKAECQFAQGLSPNNDNKNDFFIIDCALRYPKNDIIIFNRWGNEIYNASPYKNDWNGLYKNEPLPDGTYYYIFNFNDGKHEPHQGFVVIHR